MLHAQYIVAVSSVAAECDIPNIPFEEIDINNIYSQFNKFLLVVQREVAKIRVRKHRNRHFSVQLAQNTRTKIEHYIARIREAIDQAGLPSDRKERLHDQLDELVKELQGRRLNFGKAMAVLGLVMASVASTVTIAADGPEAVASVANIIKLIGIDKESEDAARQRLAPPPKALPAPRAKPSKLADELDDDIPF